MEPKPIPITRSMLPQPEEYDAYLRDVFDSGHLTNGAKYATRLEAALARKFEVPYLCLTANGTLSLQLALHLKHLQGKEVITTPFTYVATATALLWEHCTPVFADIDEESLCLSPESVARRISPRTGGILGVHIYGNACDVEGLGALAQAHGLVCMYDAAQATGCVYKGRSLLAYGDVSICSFHATKVFHTVEGGGVICHSKADRDALLLLRAFGHHGERYEGVGINAKMSELHAIMGMALLPRMEENIEGRKRVSAMYDALLPLPGLRRPRLREGLEYNYSYYPVIFDEPARMMRVLEALHAQAVYARRYFYPSLNTLDYMPVGNACPVSEDIAARVLCLPLYAELEATDVERIVDIIRGT